MSITFSDFDENFEMSFGVGRFPEKDVELFVELPVSATATIRKVLVSGILKKREDAMTIGQKAIGQMTIYRWAEELLVVIYNFL